MKRHKSVRLEEDNAAWLEAEAANRACSEGEVLNELIELHREDTIPFMVKEILALLKGR